MAGRSEEAIESARAAIHLLPGSAMAWFNLGCALHYAGRSTEAIDAYENAIEADPELQAAYVNLGCLLLDAGRPEKAMIPARRAVELEPSEGLWATGSEPAGGGVPMGKAALLARARAQALILLAKCLAGTGRYGEALARYGKARGLDRSSEPEVLNNTAWILATAPDPDLRDPEEAVRLAERALELAPENWTLRNTLGVSYYRAGRYKDAIRELTASRRRPGAQYLAHDGFFLAMAHGRLGQEEDALEWYDRSVRWMKANGPDDEELKRFRAEASELIEAVRDRGGK
jgi:tetratricopeptide (TPR) repeat protein